MMHLIKFRAMGCQVSVQLETGAGHTGILQQVPAQIAAIESRLTRFRPDSELMRLNAHAGEWVKASSVLFENIRAAKHAALLTAGLYNPLVLPAMIANGYDRSFDRLDTVSAQPTQPAHDWHAINLRQKTHEVYIPEGSALDLGGIAKGWTAACIADDLNSYGPCLVDIGGDIVARDTPEGLPGWPVDIEDPFTGDVYSTVHLCNQAITTSGIDYRHWQDKQGRHHHHIIDPLTGESASTDVLAVTVVHPNAATAEAYSKAVLLRGAEEGLDWLNQQWHTAGLVFRNDGAVLATSTFIPLTAERITQS